MRSIRPILFALLIAGAFYYFTTYRRAPSPESTSWVTRPTQVDITQAAGPQSLDPEEQENIGVYKKALPSVVNITSTNVAFDFFYGLVPQQGQGSGFIIDKAGHILTNYHVIGDNPRRLEVTLSNRKKYSAEIVGLDKSHDLAVIQIKAPGDLTPAVMGDSRGLQVGQKVFAIGNPFGLAGTMTRGIVSSIRSVREPEGGAIIDEAIQTDAPINPGNSGGPLLNSRGEVIGINTLILSSVGQSAGIGFAIPINAAKAVLNDLVQFGQVRRPVLGIRSLPIGPELAAQMGLPADYGVLILSVIPGGPADRAGLHGGSEKAYLGNTQIMIGGDLIVRMEDQDIEDQQDIAHVMNQHHAGDKIKVTFFRGKNRMETTVTLGEARSYSGA
ncbi:MAG TPA: trypsin-like peptidase domain-containing protein [Terriglobales bacterium]|jgi:S1-C subfamily serine protease|nr:trypsin-like peptidase domain-containing protein [Terriglobales bacterium]